MQYFLLEEQNGESKKGEISYNYRLSELTGATTIEEARQKVNELINNSPAFMISRACIFEINQIIHLDVDELTANRQRVQTHLSQQKKEQDERELFEQLKKKFTGDQA